MREFFEKFFGLVVLLLLSRLWTGVVYGLLLMAVYKMGGVFAAVAVGALPFLFIGGLALFAVHSPPGGYGK